MKYSKSLMIILSACGTLLILIAIILTISTPKHMQVLYKVNNKVNSVGGSVKSDVIYEIKSGKVVASSLTSELNLENKEKTLELYEKLSQIFSKEFDENISYSLTYSDTKIMITEVIENYSKIPNSINPFLHELNGMLKYDKKISSNDILNMLKEKNISYEKVENPRNSIKIVSGSGVPI